MSDAASGPQWTLRTRSTAYAVSLLPDRSGAVLDGWGVDGGAWSAAPWDEPDRVVGFVVPADVQPLEYASAGARQAAFSELRVDRGDGLLGAAWTALEEVRWRSDESGDLLELPFADETSTLRITLRWRTSRTHDVVRRSVLVRNDGERPVELPRVFSAGWNLATGRRARIHSLHGWWAREFRRESIHLGGGVWSTGSRQGVTGLDVSPVVTIEPVPDGGPAHPDGTAWGIALDWSGSWRLRVETPEVGRHTRVSCGVHEDSATLLLDPGEEFATPDALGLVSADGPAGVTHAWQDFARAELRRDLVRPVVYNSWYATGFDVTLDGQTRLAERAAALGVECFVVDDGWFAGRDSDASGLGDWTPDPAAFPHGLGELADRVRALGMRFGVWIEPECVDPDSDHYRAHPDWVYRAGERPLVAVRNQYVLDLGREDVVAWVEDTLRTLLRSADIGYLKWDMNRAIGDGGRPGDRHGREWSIQHTRNYHRVLRMLRREFPDLIVEACASGGGRIDPAVLGLADVVWTSDEVGPRDRLCIQHGYLSAYPAWAMSSWVADDAGHRDRLPVSLGYRFAVAMAGVLGVGADLEAWSDAERAEAAERVAVYRELRGVLQHGDVTVHGDPDDDGYALEYRGPDEDLRTILIVYDRDRDRSRDEEAVRVFPTALRDGVAYRVAGTGERVTAASARGVGVRVPFAWAPDADVLVLEPDGGVG